MLLALRFYVFWTNIVALQYFGEPVERKYISDLIQTQRRIHTVDGQRNVSYLKDAIAPFLGLTKANEGKWKYNMSLGITAFAFTHSQGLLPLLNKDMYVDHLLYRYVSGLFR